MSRETVGDECCGSCAARFPLAFHVKRADPRRVRAVSRGTTSACGTVAIRSAGRCTRTARPPRRTVAPSPHPRHPAIAACKLPFPVHRSACYNPPRAVRIACDAGKEAAVGRTLCVANQKGGVGKTTTAVNLAGGAGQGRLPNPAGRSRSAVQRHQRAGPAADRQPSAGGRHAAPPRRRAPTRHRRGWTCCPAAAAFATSRP